MFPPLDRLTDGEKKIYIAIISVTCVSAFLAYATILRFGVGGTVFTEVDPMTIWTLCAGGLGGVFAFLASYKTYLGHEGIGGWAKALCGGIVLTGIGAVISGTLILPYYGTMFAPFQLVIAMIEFPLLAAVWAAMIICLHKLVQQWRRERDSIFVVRGRKEPIT